MSKALNNIDLTAAQRKEVAALLKRYLPDTEVWAYGSRVKFTAKPHSDLDMVAFASKEQSQAVANLREAFEESYLPFRVDLFVWDEVPEEFRKNIEEARVVVQKEKTGCELPKEWQRISFSDAVHLNPTVKLTKGNRYPFVDMKSLNPACREVVPNEMRTFQSGGARFLPKDTLLARITPCLENGKIARYNPIGTNREAFGSTEFIVIRGKDGVTDNNFVYYLTIWPEFRKFAISQMTGSSGRQRVPVGSLAGFTFNLPPLSEQKAIVQILGSLDDKIELNRRMNETLEAMAQALFKSWFVDFDPVIDNALAAGNPVPDELKEKAAIRQALGDKRKSLPNDIRRFFPSEFAYTEEMGWIPKGWKTQTIDSIIEIDPAVNLSKNTVAPFVDMKALPLKGYSVTAINKKPYAGGAKFQNGDVLVARITPCLENGKTAIVDFLDSGQVGFGSTEFIVLRGKAHISTPFVACLSRNAEFREHCIKSMVGSSGRQRVQKDCFSNFYLSLPEKDMLLKKFFLLTEKNFEQAHKFSKQSRLLADLRDTLFPNLLSGEIDVSILSTTEETA